MIQAIDRFILDNIDVLSAKDLFEFYNALHHELKRFFGGSWGFEGVTEVLIFRALHLIIGEVEQIVEVTRDLKAFYYRRRNIVLGAGLPLKIGNKVIWPDIIVYEPKKGNPAEMKKLNSVIEIKAYPQGGLKTIKDAIMRLDNIHEYYNNSKSALIVYGINVKYKKRSKIWKYLHRELEGEESIPIYIDVILLEECYNNRITDLFTPYVLT